MREIPVWVVVFFFCFGYVWVALWSYFALELALYSIHVNTPTDPRRMIENRGVKTVDFAVIGVQKGGTSSVSAWLWRHPQVNHPAVKELLYWQKCNKSIENYLNNFPKKSFNFLGQKYATGVCTSCAVCFVCRVFVVRLLMYASIIVNNFTYPFFLQELQLNPSAP